jgi:hypothetical protein
LEKLARRNGYEKVDDGKYFPQEMLEKGGLWEGLPEVLSPDFDMETICSRVSQKLPVSKFLLRGRILLTPV